MEASGIFDDGLFIVIYRNLFRISSTDVVEGLLYQLLALWAKPAIQSRHELDRCSCGPNKLPRAVMERTLHEADFIGCAKFKDALTENTLLEVISI